MLVSYGGIQAWLGNLRYDNTVKRRYCAAWQCPQEFGDDRTAKMLKEGELPELLRGLLVDPASAYAWANVAEAERDAGQTGLAKYGFERAVEAGPGDPAILFRAAQFGILTNNPEAVLRDLGSILRNPELTAYYQAAFQMYGRLGLPIEELLDQGIPAAKAAATPFLQFWMDGHRQPEAAATWHWMVQHSLTDESSCGRYVSFLEQHNEIAEAAKEWRRAYATQAATYQVLNWLFNAGFEMEPKPGPFDWHIETMPDVAATRVQDVSRDGQWSVKIVFDGKGNPEYHGVYQDAAIFRGRWSVRAFFKMDAMASDQGIALRVYDPRDPRRLDVRAEAKAGTNEWAQIERDFVVDAQTKLARIEIMHSRSSQTDNIIVGRVWVDSLYLNPIR
jgi:hypothetical protein